MCFVSFSMRMRNRLYLSNQIKKGKVKGRTVRSNRVYKESKK